MPKPFRHKHLLGIENLSKSDIISLLDYSEELARGGKEALKKKKGVLAGKTQINIFFEASTRTQSSFELAGKRLGADVMNMNVSSSAIKKGETLLDTAATLDAMQPDLLIVRHPAAGAVHLLAEKVDCCMVNAGDGSHEHPTQALLDALTIRLRCGEISGLTVAICGDITHSRVARSNILLLTSLGAQVRVIAPATLLPPGIEKFGVTAFTDMRAGLREVDIIMMVRLQRERMTTSFIASRREYFHYYGLDQDKLQLAKPGALVMHPGPINRGFEIDSDVADSPQSLIGQQVEMGLVTRMAVLETLSSNLLLRE